MSVLGRENKNGVIPGLVPGIHPSASRECEWFQRGRATTRSVVSAARWIPGDKHRNDVDGSGLVSLAGRTER